MRAVALLLLLRPLPALSPPAPSPAAGRRRQSGAAPVAGGDRRCRRRGRGKGPRGDEGWLDGCSSARRVFDRFFGPLHLREWPVTCIVGFEGNPAHTKMLKGLQATLSAAGPRVVFHTETAVGGNDGQATFWVAKDDVEKMVLALEENRRLAKKAKGGSRLPAGAASVVSRRLLKAGTKRKRGGSVEAGYECTPMVFGENQVGAG
eukprot:gene11226-53451_t